MRFARPVRRRCIRAMASCRKTRFAEALEAEGVTFIGPPGRHRKRWATRSPPRSWPPEAGRQHRAGPYGPDREHEDAVKISQEIGYPVMIKASAGGGGKGMRVAWMTTRRVEEGFPAVQERGGRRLRR